MIAALNSGPRQTERVCDAGRYVAGKCSCFVKRRECGYDLPRARRGI